MLGLAERLSASWRRMSSCLHHSLCHSSISQSPSASPPYPSSTTYSSPTNSPIHSALSSATASCSTIYTSFYLPDRQPAPASDQKFTFAIPHQVYLYRTSLSVLTASLLKYDLILTSLEVSTLLFWLCNHWPLSRASRPAPASRRLPSPSYLWQYGIRSFWQQIAVACV